MSIRITTVRLPDGIYCKLKAEAVKRRMTMAALIIAALLAYFEEQSEGLSK